MSGHVEALDLERVGERGNISWPVEQGSARLGR
jgi:hypothetical protein